MSSIMARVGKVERVALNARSAEWKLTPDELAELRAILQGKREGEGRCTRRTSWKEARNCCDPHRGFGYP